MEQSEIKIVLVTFIPMTGWRKKSKNGSSMNRKICGVIDSIDGNKVNLEVTIVAHQNHWIDTRRPMMSLGEKHLLKVAYGLQSRKSGVIHLRQSLTADKRQVRAVFVQKTPKETKNDN